MGRPALPIGGWGRVGFLHSDGRVRARVRVRDADGVLRAVSRWGDSEVEAGARLAVAVREHDPGGGGELRGATRVRVAVDLWLTEIEQSSLSDSSRQLYRAAARRYILPTLGTLCLAELTVPALERALAVVRTRHGPHCARAARCAMSSLCRCAVRHGALSVNPVSGTRPVSCPRRRVRALTSGEAIDLLARLRQDPVAVRLDLPDFVAFMLGTGVRIGEASAVRQSVLDLNAGTVHINATITRVAGAGLQIQPRCKTDGSQRTLCLPPALITLLRSREVRGHARGPAGVIFTSPSGHLRDPSNTEADLRRALDRAGYPWVTSHVFRKTVASHLDDAGYSIRQIADQLGHARPSTTLNYYLGRRAVTTPDSARDLEVLVGAGT